MSCQHDHEVLMSALSENGALPTQLQQQTQTCASCAAFVRAAAGLDGFLREADPDLDPSGAFSLRVQQAIQTERRAAAAEKAWWRRPAFFATALSGCAAAVLAVTLFIRDPALSEDDLFVADHQEMLAELDLMQQMDAVEDFAVIAELDSLTKQD